MNTTLHVVTTCNADGWKRYGKRMVETFLKHWDTDIDLTLYAEGFVPSSDLDINVADFPPWFYKWKATHANNSTAHGLDRSKNRRKAAYDFRFDCVRFAHKVAAITDIEVDTDFLLWIDADTVTHKPTKAEWILSFFNDAESYMAWLDRVGTYPECGFILFNQRHDAHRAFMSRLLNTYKYNDVFMYRETHDSYVIQQLVLACVKDGMFRQPISLSGEAGRKTHHPFVYSGLGERLDHLKGDRKIVGKSKERKHETSMRLVVAR